MRRGKCPVRPQRHGLQESKTEIWQTGLGTGERVSWVAEQGVVSGVWKGGGGVV